MVILKPAGKLGSIRKLMAGSALFGLVSIFWVSTVAAQTANDLTLQKIPAASFANPGTTIAVISRATNLGSAPISGIVIQDVWPVEFIVDGQPASVSTWSAGTLAPGQTASQSYNVTLPSTITAGRYTLITSATSKSPFISKSLEYSFEIREIRVLALETEEIPSAGGFGQLDVLGLALILQLMMISGISFKLSNFYNYEA